MSLENSDYEKKEKLYQKLRQFGPLITVVSYLAGIVYFCMLPHDSLVHGTYISESALLPGLVSSDIYSPDIVYNYYDLLKAHYESKNTKELDVEFIRDIFSKRIKIEAYIQHFNVSNPFFDETKKENINHRNVYAFGRSQRADGTESIVVSAPLFLVNKKNNKQTPNLVGISQLFMMAELARSRPYWAKDLIFVVTDMGSIGMQAWINSYFETESDYIKGENLKRRGGSIQAALNLEFRDINLNKLELKLEGPNGKLPNLDLFNTIIRICKSVQFDCSLESEKASDDDFTYYHNRPPVDYKSGVRNTFMMLFKQASGIPSSMHGYFLNHRIEALTISGAKNPIESKRQTTKQNLLKATRIIESTLRSINNLLERFHQSFFFYLLPSSHYYISIGMYMPAFGLVVLPILIQILSLWFSIFFKNIPLPSDNKESSLIVFDLFRLIIPRILLSASFGILFYFGTSYFFYFGKKFGLNQKDSLVNCYIALTVNILAAPLFFKLLSKSNEKQDQFLKDTSEKLIRIFILLALIIFLGTISLLNFSFAFLIAIFYVPVSVSAIQITGNKMVKLIQLVLVILSSPIVYFLILYLINSYFFENSIINFDNFKNIIQIMSDKFHDLVIMSTISNIWTYDLVNLFLIPIWASLWFISF